MGARWVAAAYATWNGELPDPAFRLLVYMALVCKDADAEPTFWKGRRALAFGIGRGVEDNQEIPKATLQAIKRALQTLTKAGAIEAVYGGWRGKNTEYRLHLMVPGKGYAPRTSLDECGDEERGTPHVPERGTPGDPKGVRPTVQRGTPGVPPRSTRRSRSEMEDEISSTEVSPDRACEPTTDEIDLLSAKRILKEEFEDLGRALARQSPRGVTGDDAIIWAAMQVLARREAS
jgi:hypothetical protein